MADKASVLALRITDDGLEVEGDAPAVHVFSAKQVHRAIEGGHFVVTLDLNGQAAYELEGFELLDPDDPDKGLNLSAWRCRRIE